MAGTLIQPIPPGEYTLALVRITSKGTAEMEVVEGPHKGKKVYAPAHMVPQFTGIIEQVPYRGNAIINSVKELK